MAGRKATYQLQYLVGRDGDCEQPGAPSGSWADCVSDTCVGGTELGPASLRICKASKSEMLDLYPDTAYRIINLETQKVVA